MLFVVVAVVCCLLAGVSCMQCVACRTWFVVCCATMRVYFVAVCCQLLVACRLPTVVCRLSIVVCCVMSVCL